MKKSNINILDLFSGTGAFSHGFTKCSKRFNIVGSIDIERYAIDTVKANHPNSLAIQGDIRNVPPKLFAKNLNFVGIDLIIGGPPCQGFSSLRPNRSSNIDDPRNSLFTQFADYVSYFRPKYFVLENVVGLVTHNSGKTLKNLENAFKKIGYQTDWKIVNAANFGVPQKRERFIMIGALKGYDIVFPKPLNHFNGRIIGHKDKSRMILSDSSLPKAISVYEAISDLPPIESGEVGVEYVSQPLNYYQMERRRNSKLLTLHTACFHSKKMLEIIKHAGSSKESIPKNLITSGFSSCYSRLDPATPSNTITVKFTSPASSRCIHPFQNRSITPREAARLQSFDDDFEFIGSKTDTANMIGNAVPPILGQSIASILLKNY